MYRLLHLSLPFFVLVLAGCQTLAAPDPLARNVEPLPVPCTWTRSDQAPRELWIRASVEALEARGYAIRHTEPRLGVVSAERTTRLPGLGAVDRPLFGGSGIWGSVGSRGSGVSVGFGTGFGTRYSDDPIEIERLSVIVGEQEVSITRDASVVDAGGYVRHAGTENRSDFCRELSASIESRVRALESQQ
ncbi:hypothetical protein SAMN02745148_02496 [Modicisalibacter ilicicola DSM 19980]|uniref:DUF4136 domain-containing protein n=1 Tax=Modicisalibacter ilicicola DSM 19980 TaxID=1121942 RepID=A0A1M5B6U6_9GAMM|nr:hypothetical protein [Halomonas ilicicola]SHF38136.1 hypothetical protein SAMN02745148_02496 [Halomonas ilicicola DSM 19980]